MQLEEAKNLEHEERIRKEEEIRAKQEEIEEIRCCGNLLVYQARESSLVPAGGLTAQFLQKLRFMNSLL